MENFRTYLQQEFARRRERNPQYSLRAFAKQLQLSPGSLSQFLHGHRNYSSKKLFQICLSLNLDKQQTSQFLLAENFTDKFALIESDRFDLLSKWYYAAILECLSLKGFEPNANWIARRLNLSVSMVKSALNMLFQFGVLTHNSDGSWKNNWAFYTTQKNENVDEEALRIHQKQLLEMAEKSIDEFPAEWKSHTAYVAAVDARLIPEIKSEIGKFRRKIAKLIEIKSKRKDAIYCLQINLFAEDHFQEER